jgi:uncharacterized damage-inducible protein DinB
MGMNALRNIQMLASYSAWANARLYDSLHALSHQEEDKHRAGIGKMLRILNHASIIDRVWRAHLEGKPHGFMARNTETAPPLGELYVAQSTLDEWYVAYASNLSMTMLDEVIQFQFIGGGDGKMSRADILLHVVNHKTYHRGYVAQMMYDHSVHPPTMDLPVFLRDAWQGSI